MLSIKCLLLRPQASAGVTLLVMVTLIVLISVLGLQVSWQEIRILKLVDVLKNPFLLQEIEVYLFRYLTESVYI